MFMSSRRGMPGLVSLVAWLVTVSGAAQTDVGETLLLQQPTISADHVVFVYAQDLWIVGRDGGVARRLTSHVESERAPALSPDAKLVAFTGQYDGNDDVYVIPIEGGIPRRLTFHPGRDVVQGWHPDGKRILFTSDRDGGAPVERAFLVSADGGNPEPLPMPKVARARLSGDGTHVAYTPIRDAFRTWKRYRGGQTTPIWIFDLSTFATEQIPHENASDTFPCWVGADVYFMSDRDGHMNLWRFTPGGSAPQQLTRFTDFDVRSVSSGAGVVVFEQAGAIHVWDPAKGSDTRLRVTVPADGLGARPRWSEAKGFVRGAAIAPNGKRVAAEVRGDIVTFPREFGDPRAVTDSPSAHDQSPAWSPDGTQLAWLSDESGEYRLLMRDERGVESPRAFDLGPGGFFFELTWSPDGKHISFHDRSGRIAFVTLETGVVTTIGSWPAAFGGSRGTASWSRDSRTIALATRDPATLYDSIQLYDLQTGKLTAITDGFGSADQPAFSMDGKYLFFRATVDGGMRRFGLDMSSRASRDPTMSLYAVVLQRSQKNPLAPKSDEASDDKKAAAESKPTAESRPAVELDGIDQRIVALPLPPRTYSGLACTKTRLLFLEASEPGASDATLRSFDFESRKAEDVVAKLSSFAVSASGEHLLVRMGDEISIASAEGKDKKVVGFDKVKVRVEPTVEWRQMLREVWRIHRDYFYDPKMHGVDWNAMWERWQAFLPHVRQRDDLNLVIAEMIGELACGHENVNGGDRPTAPESPGTGLLGADFSVEEGRHRIRTIYRGQNWNPTLRAPLTEPGVDAKVGDYLLAVDGRPLAGTQDLYAAFVGTANRQTVLTLSSTPDGAGARKVTVVPIASDTMLRRRAWVEANRRRVDALSNGRLAYVHMPDTGSSGKEAFDRDFYSELGRDGVILDERYNTGGMAADYVIATLSRQVIGHWMTREGWAARTPFATIPGPKVMIANENAGSGGDWMPWAFQRLKVGPVVGMRTWGGAVGIGPGIVLMDGGTVTPPAFGAMDADGHWAIENEGVAPDYEVVEWPKDVIAGHDPQLEKAVALALAELEKNPPKPRPSFTSPKPR